MKLTKITNKLLKLSIVSMLVLFFVIFQVQAEEASSSRSMISSTSVSHFIQTKKEIINGNNNFKLNLLSKKKDFSISENPELEFKFRKKQNFVKTFGSFLKNIFVDDYEDMNIKSKIKNQKSKIFNEDLFEINYINNGKFKISLKKKFREFGIGKHSLEIYISDPELTGGETVYFTQDFTWGVLAINFNKTIYRPGEKAYIQMAVLDDEGDTLCDAKINLEIIKPNGKKIKLSTKKKDIIKNEKCGHNNVMNEPDYYTYFDLSDAGEYQIKMIAETENGERTIEDKFRVEENSSLEVERIAPTRIYPYADYNIKLKIKAHASYQGDFSDFVPEDFIIKKQVLKINNTDFQNTEFEIKKEDDAQKLIWKNLDLKKGDEMEIIYKVDFPNISPEFYLLGEAQTDNFSEIRNWQIASDAVGAGIAWLTGTSTTLGKNLNQGSSYAMEWSISDFDSTKYSHSLSSNPSRLVIEEAGDYLVGLTIPMIREDANSSRTRIEAEIRVNGIKKDVGVGRSSYIRNYNGLYNKQSSDHLHVLLDDLSVDDYIEVFVHGITTVDSGDSVIVYDLASMYAEKIEASEIVFFGDGTETTDSTNLNQATAYEMKWDSESRKDSGFTHSEITNPEDITLDSAGDYLVFINIPLYGDTTDRQNIMGRVLLDGTQVDGGEFSQGYIRDSEDDDYSSIHWSGVVQSSASNQILSVSVEMEAAAGTVTVGTDKATVYVQKLPSSEFILDGGLIYLQVLTGIRLDRFQFFGKMTI